MAQLMGINELQRVKPPTAAGAETLRGESSPNTTTSMGRYAWGAGRLFIGELLV